MKIRWTKRASDHLEYIEKYIGKENPQALKTVLKVIDRVELLIYHPNLGKPGRLLNTRELSIAGIPYIVVYRVRNLNVEILAVLHTAICWKDVIPSI